MKQQKPDLRCQSCKAGRCDDCTDVLRAALGLSMKCPCNRIGHSGEPEPDDGTVDLAPV